MPRVLVVDDSLTVRLQLTDILRRILGPQWVIEQAADRSQAERSVLLGGADLVFLDVMLPAYPETARIALDGTVAPSPPPGDSEGLAVLELILDIEPRTRVVVMTGLPREDERVVEAISQGASAYVRKPLTAQAISSVIAQAGSA